MCEVKPSTLYILINFSLRALRGNLVFLLISVCHCRKSSGYGTINLYSDKYISDKIVHFILNSKHLFFSLRSMHTYYPRCSYIIFQTRPPWIFTCIKSHSKTLKFCMSAKNIPVYLVCVTTYHRLWLQHRNSLYRLRPFNSI